MVEKNESALRLIFDTIDEINMTLPAERQLEKSSATSLFGLQGGLKSLEFVNFIVMLEQRIADEFGRAVTLADERAISREASPFSTVERLAAYVAEMVGELDNG